MSIIIIITITALPSCIIDGALNPEPAQTS